MISRLSKKGNIKPILDFLQQNHSVSSLWIQMKENALTNPIEEKSRVNY